MSSRSPPKTDSNKSKVIRCPESVLPSELEDEKRKTFLFASFKERHENPISYDSKMNFWKKLIAKYCEETGVFCFDEIFLRDAFQRDGQEPACLGLVLEALRRDGTVSLKSDFTRHGYRGQSWASWTKDVVVVKPVSFAATRLWKSLGYDTDSVPSTAVYPPKEKFICFKTIEFEAEELLHKYSPDPHHHQHAASPAIPLPTLVQDEGSDVTLLLMCLCRQNKAVVDESVSPPLVKLGAGAQVTELDRQTLSLRKQEAALQQRLEDMELEQGRLTQEAKDFLKQNMRQAAKGCLRRKRELERRLDKLTDALTNIHVLMSQLEESESNVKVLESYKAAAAALKTTFKENNLNEDGAAKTMDEVEEALDMHEDVKTLISQPMGPSAMLDETGLENELAELLADSGEGGEGGGGITTPSKEPEYHLPDLPEVPTTPLKTSLLLGD